MTWFIGQSVFIIAVAFLLGILVGWLIWGRILRPDRARSGAPEHGAEVAPTQEEAAPAVVTVQAVPVVVPQAAAPAVEQPSDDLERIEGIGPKMAGALIESGIRSYVRLAAADQGTLRNAIEAEGLRFAPSIVTWSRQAQLLADGDEAGFEDLARRLVAGRDEGRE